MAILSWHHSYTAQYSTVSICDETQRTKNSLLFYKIQTNHSQITYGTSILYSVTSGYPSFMTSWHPDIIHSYTVLYSTVHTVQTVLYRTCSFDLLTSVVVVRYAAKARLPIIICFFITNSSTVQNVFVRLAYFRTVVVVRYAAKARLSYYHNLFLYNEAKAQRTPCFLIFQLHNSRCNVERWLIDWLIVECMHRGWAFLYYNQYLLLCDDERKVIPVVKNFGD